MIPPSPIQQAFQSLLAAIEAGQRPSVEIDWDEIDATPVDIY